VSEDIKKQRGNWRAHVENYKASLENLAAAGIEVICYNFMPVLDWTRTDLAYPLPGGGRALRFDAVAYAAFDCFMVARKDADADHAPETVARAQRWFASASEDAKAKLLANIMAGLPGAFDRYDVPALRTMLARYSDIDRAALRNNLARFLREVIPTAEEAGIRMCIHPDDPPRPLLGLPRIVCNADDLAFVTDCVPSPANGITFCTGSLGAGQHNDVPAMARRFASHIQFAHLRNVTKEPDGSFVEADHLGGDVDMVSVVTTLLEEQKRRRDGGDPRWRIPFRPDHGHQLLDDVGKKTHPATRLSGACAGLPRFAA
jgi:mannonate dehydratase